MDIEYVRQKITELRIKRNISEYQLGTAKTMFITLLLVILNLL